MTISLNTGIASDASLGQNASKSVILLIGDGMGYSQLTAARIEKSGENLSAYGNTSLNMDHLEYDGYVATYSADSWVTDSAAAVTAMATGQKGNNDVLNQDATSVWKKKDGKNLTTISEMAKKAGMSTGVVTTTRITHATPAGFYAHINDRDAEEKIAGQLLESSIDVALGGGLQFFVAKNQTTPLGGNGKRADNRTLFDAFDARGYTFVYNDTAFKKIDANSTSKVLGLFNKDHMAYELERRNQTSPEPSLANMTVKALEILSKNPKGFFLMVEGGRIDHAAHARSYDNMTVDTLAFDDAVKAAMDFALANNNTLVLVTADHECGGVVLGAKDPNDYPAGMVPVFGSGLAEAHAERYNLTATGKEATHTAVDVPIMAMGPGADRVTHGMIDNTEIFDISRGALGL
ncbi:MAG TPA: alkaline phosphatase [Methanotrichaceae archaeon]|nr:alkaline phosphatase [Methanotrichaceae archaeon]